MTRQDLTVNNRTTSLHLSAPPGTPIAGVLVLHPWWGLNDEEATDALVLASVDALRAAVGEPTARLAVLGFSLGAAWALWLPAQRPEIVASVVYYGTIQGPSLSRARTPVLGHFAEADEYEPEAGVTAFESTLLAAGRKAELHRYPGTGHWFAEPSRDAYVPAASELAFDRTVTFLRRELVDKR